MLTVKELLELGHRVDELAGLIVELGPRVGPIGKTVAVPLAHALEQVEWCKRGLALELGTAYMVEHAREPADV